VVFVGDSLTGGWKGLARDFKMAAGHKNTRFCDLFTATANADGSPKLEYFAADKLHMSPAGHAKWAELLAPIFGELKLQ
jgi:lysophospholipase L1-like esterase